MLPVVLHPSLARPAADFAPIVPALEAAGHEVVLVESGRGATLHDLASHVVAQLDARGIERAHLVGHAFGNRVMRCVAADHGARVASLTLFGCGGRVPGDAEATAALGTILWGDAPRADRIAALRIAMFAPGNDVPPDWVDGWDAELARSQHLASAATDLADWWTAGTVAPVCIVQGLDDRMAPPENGRMLAATIGERATLVELAGMGHAMLPECPDDLARVLLEVLGASGA